MLKSKMDQSTLKRIKKHVHYNPKGCMDCIDNCCKDRTTLLIQKDIETIMNLGYAKDHFVKTKYKLLHKFDFMKSNENGFCVFHKNGGCGIYEARPMECRIFPVYWLCKNICFIEIRSECKYIRENTDTIAIDDYYRQMKAGRLPLNYYGKRILAEWLQLSNE